MEQQERCALVRSLAEDADDLEESAGGRTVSDRLSSVPAAEFASVASLRPG